LIDIVNIKIGDVVAYKGTNLVSKAIINITNSSYSHVAIYMGNNIICEADGYTGHVRCRDILEYKNHLDIYILESLTDEQRQKICDYVISKIGNKYSYFLTLWLGIKYIFGILLPFIDTKTSENCSELVNLAYGSIGLRLCADKWPTPEQIVHSELLVKCGEY